jgi:hypothetical protein
MRPCCTGQEGQSTSNEQTIRHELESKCGSVEPNCGGDVTPVTSRKLLCDCLSIAAGPALSTLDVPIYTMSLVRDPPRQCVLCVGSDGERPAPRRRHWLLQQLSQSFRGSPGTGRQLVHQSCKHEQATDPAVPGRPDPRFKFFFPDSRGRASPGPRPHPTDRPSPRAPW